MYYKAKRVDTDKALQAIEESRKYQDRAIHFRIEKERSFLEGVNKGLDIAQGIFECSNYEKDEEPSYTDGILDFMYELGEELGVLNQDIRENFSSVDESCAELAQRIREKYMDSEDN